MRNWNLRFVNGHAVLKLVHNYYARHLILFDMDNLHSIGMFDEQFTAFIVHAALWRSLFSIEIYDNVDITRQRIFDLPFN